MVHLPALTASGLSRTGEELPAVSKAAHRMRSNRRRRPEAHLRVEGPYPGDILRHDQRPVERALAEAGATCGRDEIHSLPPASSGSGVRRCGGWGTRAGWRSRRPRSSVGEYARQRGHHLVEGPVRAPRHRRPRCSRTVRRADLASGRVPGTAGRDASETRGRSRADVQAHALARLQQRNGAPSPSTDRSPARRGRSGDRRVGVHRNRSFRAPTRAIRASSSP
jgi:hypothetical protein